MGHVIQRVGRAAAAANLCVQVVPGQVRCTAHAAGLADVAVVETDHPKARLDKAVYQRVGPCGQLLGKAMDQQHRWRMFGPEGLVGEGDAADAGKSRVRGQWRSPLWMDNTAQQKRS
ncbi:hypothetical protein D3C76_1348840 [compost metagenome]